MEPELVLFLAEKFPGFPLTTTIGHKLGFMELY